MDKISIPESRRSVKVNIPVSSNSSKVCKDLQYTTKDTSSEKKSTMSVYMCIVQISLLMYLCLQSHYTACLAIQLVKMISYSLSYFVPWNSFTHLWFREKVSAMCLKQHQLAQGVRFSRTVIIRYIKWSTNWLSLHALFFILRVCTCIQVISATKYIVHKESTRDHMD